MRSRTSCARKLNIDCDVAAVLIDLPPRRSLSLHLSRPVSAECRREAAAEARRAHATLGGRAGFTEEPVALPMEAFDEGAAMLQGGLRSRCAAPLVRRGEVVGSIVAFGRLEGAFPESRARLFHTLANQASLTLDMRTMFAGLVVLAVTGVSLTVLANALERRLLYWHVSERTNG